MTVDTIFKLMTFSAASVGLQHHVMKYYKRQLGTERVQAFTFCVRVTTPPQYGQNGTVHAAGASMFSLARGVFTGMRSAWHCIWWAWRITAGLCHAFLVLP